MQTLDPNLLIRNLDGDVELVARIVELFFESTAPVVAALRVGVAEGDPEALARNAHQLRGALANVGAQAAAGAATELERLALGGALEPAAQALDALETELARLRPALQALVAAARSRDDA